MIKIYLTMARLLFMVFGFFFFVIACVNAEEPHPSYQQYSEHFKEAYAQYPSIPGGILEGVAFTQTRFQHIRPAQIPESCTGLPGYHGVMGLIENGKGYFRANLKTVARLSDKSREQLVQSPRHNILGYAAAYRHLRQQMGITSRKPEDQLPVLAALSEIPPDTSTQNDFALNAFLYSVLRFMDKQHTTYNLPAHQINFVKAFGKQNYQVLSASSITIQNGNVKTKKGVSFQSSKLQSGPDYPPAIWDPAPSCNYSSRNGTAISAVTIHTIQGSYSGAISWFKNCNANVSSHYLIRSIDGQVTQMVHEQDKAWHVNSANPYTIGFEHEGYINDASWYTDAMYKSSAGIVRDITTSGYGINPLRTYDGPACSGGSQSCELTPCIKIKGHHHFPNQTHTDPGPNWDWEFYYRLINNNPQIITKTAASGTFTDQAGPSSNYNNDQRAMWLIQPSGASSITLSFPSFHIEKDWDYLHIYDGDTIGAPLIGRYTGTNGPGTINSSGGSLLVEFRSDCGVTKPGWEASWTSSSSSSSTDSIPPVTSIKGLNAWETEDFPVHFSDSDKAGGSGVAQRFFQVIHNNGTAWRANAQKGFYSDNFDSIIHPEWQSATGSWSINNNSLYQNDESSSNTNLYTAVNQTNASAYLYHWAGMMDGSGNNRRAGLHFSCDSPTLSNRGNSYFVYARVEDDHLQIYKVTNNVFSLEKNIVFDFQENQWYDFKVTFNRSSGRINTYVNNQYKGGWTDPSPHAGGDYISLRSGNCQYSVDNLKVYRSRDTSATVQVGTGGMARYQSQTPTSAAARVKAIVVDSANKLSPIASKDVKIDWTPPQVTWPVQDGISGDTDTLSTPTEISGNWDASADSHSAISNYWYAIGTSPGDTSIAGWTNNWYQTVMTDTGLNLNQGETYYVSIRAENGAGLLSPLRYSDGQTLVQNSASPIAQFSLSDTSICKGESIQLLNTSQNASSYQWEIPGANPSSSQQSNPTVLFDSSGTYQIELIAAGGGGNDTIIRVQSIDVWQSPQPAFQTADTLLFLPNSTAAFVNQSDHATSFQWSFGDSSQSTDQNPWHQYSSPGSYDVSLTAGNPACPWNTTTRTDYIHVQQATGIDDESVFMDVAVKPNPVTDKGAILLSLRKSREVSIRLFDVAGRSIDLITDQHFAKGRHQLPLSGVEEKMTQGIWFIEVQSGEHTSRVRFLKH